MTLVDVGVWHAAVWGRHAHHRAAANWFGEQADGLLLCRVTQTGLLRLLSNPAVMGADALSRSAAWRIVDQLNEDERVLWADEPADLEAVFRAFSAKNDNSHKLWTDDYLAAFAQTSSAAFATLDRKLAARYPSVQVITLT
ncbi:type II toxin-antitoxin system VapC family toxin [Nocardia sp. NEAU-G5]|uniref:Ribonuclease VapC n=1 Tax=Nocardia albiluteola TaxID=2842303 RepID=A0ABS6AT57_9NOCA|nr:TA system VapC family ribonuclease toxin [Nocardia albiluteola]MBU3061088.1 type II toxin-antitoxin system VapC family toxin [Nocardia albiluteola]